MLLWFLSAYFIVPNCNLMTLEKWYDQAMLESQYKYI